MLKRGRREHCSAGIGHQREGPQREAGPGEGLCLWGGWAMGWLAVKNMPGKPSFHQLFKQDNSDHGSLLFDHTLSLRKA